MKDCVRHVHKSINFLYIFGYFCVVRITVNTDKIILHIKKRWLTCVNIVKTDCKWCQIRNVCHSQHFYILTGLRLFLCCEKEGLSNISKASLSLHGSEWRNVKNNTTINSKRFFSLDLLLLGEDLMASLHEVMWAEGVFLFS